MALSLLRQTTEWAFGGEQFPVLRGLEDQVCLEKKNGGGLRLNNASTI